MAAPPSKPDSPSNQPVQQTGGENNVEASSTSATQQPVEENPTLAAKASASSVSPIEAYENSETSDFYKLAKHLLAEGDFEAALTSIEKGIEEVKKDSQTHESAIAPVRLYLLFFGRQKPRNVNANHPSHLPSLHAVSLPLRNNVTL